MKFLEKVEEILNSRIREKGYRIKIKELEEELKEIKFKSEEEIKFLKEKNERYLDTINKLKDEKVTVIRNSTFLVDFLKLNAFSIERVINNERQETVIGYWDKEGNIQEWYLLCSLDTHEKLCDLFKKQILLKDITYKKIPQR